MNKSEKAKKCAEWLSYCLSIGWDKKHLPELQKIWEGNHDENGNYVPKLIEAGKIIPQPDVIKSFCSCGAEHSNEAKYSGQCNYCLKQIREQL